ncbi:hypothetical protein RRF57_012879 [Xylaria bambusicola]|uniref:Uncharacterized protein n=1 Tax=Xylaria bambusicola TaxID=326684 RepID=A0AAN7UVZ3_9PEZI
MRPMRGDHLTSRSHREYLTATSYMKAIVASTIRRPAKAYASHCPEKVSPFNLGDSWGARTIEEGVDHVHISCV